MSTFRNPVGPQPPAVYWRRRLMVGLGLLVVIVVALMIIFRPGAADSQESKPAATAGDTEQNAEGDEDGEGAELPADEAAEQDEGGECNPANVTLEAITDLASYASGQLPQLSMRITNVGAVACIINVGTAHQVFQVTSGEETYWLSTDCQSEPTESPVIFEPSIPQQTVPINWDRTRSDPATCSSQRPAVPAGGASYHLTVKLGELQSENTAQFLLN